MDTYKCNHCDYKCKTKAHYQQHCSTKKHKRNVEGKAEEVKDWYCACCDYQTYYKDAYMKHCLTKKHKQKMSGEVVKKDDGKEKEQLCPVCYKKLKNAESFRRHMERYRTFTVYGKYIFTTTMMPGARRMLEDYFLKYGKVTGTDILYVRAEKKRILQTRLRNEKDPLQKKRLEQQLEHLKANKSKDLAILKTLESDEGIDEGCLTEESETETKDEEKELRKAQMLPRNSELAKLHADILPSRKPKTVKGRKV